MENRNFQSSYLYQVKIFNLSTNSLLRPVYEQKRCDQKRCDQQKVQKVMEKLAHEFDSSLPILLDILQVGLKASNAQVGV